MSHAAARPLCRVTPEALTQAHPGEDALAMRLLRHQTKNALQRLIAQIMASNLRSTAEGEALADDLQRRILLSARVSDALFGFTEHPGRLSDRLTALCRSTVALIADGVQVIGTRVEMEGACPERFEPTVLPMVHEMVTNAVKHGLHMRLTGQIAVVLRGPRPGSPLAGLLLEVHDNGWGPEKCGVGEGLTTMHLMARCHGGRVELTRQGEWTTSRLTIPGWL